jgi:hypothetical protein
MFIWEIEDSDCIIERRTLCKTMGLVLCGRSTAKCVQRLIFRY